MNEILVRFVIITSSYIIPMLACEVYKWWRSRCLDDTDDW